MLASLVAFIALSVPMHPVPHITASTNMAVVRVEPNVIGYKGRLIRYIDHGNLVYSEPLPSWIKSGVLTYVGKRGISSKPFLLISQKSDVWGCELKNGNANTCKWLNEG